MSALESLWGEDFEVKDTEQTKKILSKAKKPKEAKKMTTEQLLKSKTVSVEDKLETIRSEVHRILGKFEEDTILIKSEDELKAYIDAAIENGIIAIDTETNNTVNTFDCKLMGLCIYTPGQKNAYVPVNHVNRETNEKLSWQVTEEQIRNQLQRIVDNQVFEVYHNAIFDIEVLKTTCGVRLHADWDTMVGAQLLDENELKGLKVQYKLHIDPEQDKYDIEHLFKGLPYEIIEPELFALYAATDAFLTFRLWNYQYEQFHKHTIIEVNQANGIYELEETDEVETPTGFRSVKDLQIGNELLDNGNIIKVNNKIYKMNKIYLECC